MSERRRLRAAALFLFLGVLAFVSGGCTVATHVALSEQSPGRGTVAVSVALDRDALAAVGGLSALRSELSVQDLLAAGWSVSGPAAAPDGGAVVTARHGFSSDAEAGRLVSDVAGRRVFGISLSLHHTLWRTYYRLSGKVDLTCGAGCFGDSGLRAATGSPVGVDPGALSASSGQQPSSVLSFSVDARLPGGARSPAGSPGPGRTVTWAPPLGRVTTLTASSSTLNTGAVAGALGGGAALMLTAVVLLGWLVRGRRLWGRRQTPEL